MNPGIYVHVPFCQQACYYCNFHFSASQKRIIPFVHALKREMLLRKTEAKSLGTIDSIYFGGGTPSLLPTEYLSDIVSNIFTFFDISKDAEFTIEANPEDITTDWLEKIKRMGINRLSIGIQAFFDKHLTYLNRIHNAKKGIQSIKMAQSLGFTNINIDLVYGIPGMSLKEWQQSLELFFSLKIPHLSAYNLTLESRTAYEVFVKRGEMAAPNEKSGRDAFLLLMEQMEAKEFIHYEISNFSKTGFQSYHNLKYWTRVPYLGFGPSAHSFSANMRKWNIHNTSQYIKKINAGILPFESEFLTEKMCLNEYIMTSLRTNEGMDLRYICANFEQYHHGLIKEGERYVRENFLEIIDGHFILTKKGKLFADKIASDLFII